MRLQDRCPRLARARDQWVAFENARDEAVGVERTKIMHLERLVAHRDLQLVRAGARREWRGRGGQRRYLEVRQEKLQQAEEALARARRRLRRWEAMR